MVCVVVCERVCESLDGESVVVMVTVCVSVDGESVMVMVIVPASHGESVGGRAMSSPGEPPCPPPRSLPYDGRPHPPRDRHSSSGSAFGAPAIRPPRVRVASRRQPRAPARTRPPPISGAEGESEPLHVPSNKPSVVGASLARLHAPLGVPRA